MYISTLNVREYMCKAKDAKTGSWKEGSLFVNLYGDYHTMKVVESIGDMILLVPYEVLKETVCHTTEAISDNGTRIWENDIVLSKSGLVGIVKWNDDIGKHVYVFICDDNTELITPVENELITVIGNIFDNPDLVPKLVLASEKYFDNKNLLIEGGKCHA